MLVINFCDMARSLTNREAVGHKIFFNFINVIDIIALTHKILKSILKRNYFWKNEKLPGFREQKRKTKSSKKPQNHKLRLVFNNSLSNSKSIIRKILAGSIPGQVKVQVINLDKGALLPPHR